MSGFKPNMWKFKKSKPSSTLPTTNKFWADIDFDDENETTESKGDHNNTTGTNETEMQNNPAFKLKRCHKCKIMGHILKDCPLILEEENKADDKERIPAKNKKICYNCKQEGHFFKYCTSMKAEEKKTGENESATTTKGDEKPKKKLLNLSVKCFFCGQEGHPQKICPMKGKVNTARTKCDNTANTTIDLNQTTLCVICKTYGHVATDCPSHPAKQLNVEAGDSSVLKPVLKSIEQLIKDNRCTYCGVEGHLISACPVKKWRIGPGASEGGADFSEDFVSYADQKEAETKSPIVVPAGNLGNVGKQIKTLSQEDINKKAAKKKQKELRKKMLSAQKQMAFLSNPSVGMPKEVPVTFLHYPEAVVTIPVKQEMPQVPIMNQPVAPNMINNFGIRQSWPAGIPRSFLNQEHQEKIFQLNTKQQTEMNMPQANFVTGYEQNFGWQPTQLNAMPQTFVPTPGQPSPGLVPVQKEESVDKDPPQAYSPSDVYGEMRNEKPHEGSESPDPQGQKRLSAFQRLGPVTQKKPKLTINLMCNKGQAVREVVDETTELIEEHPPVHLRSDVTTSTDETVMKYLYFWPWKKSVPIRRTAAFKDSKSAMLLEQEQMEESYDKDNAFIQITVTNYPRTWSKEELFDLFLEQVNVIPCFIEFTSKECKFLVIRSKPALIGIHKMGFRIRKGNVELVLSISVTLITQNQIDFLPRLVLRKRLAMGYDGEKTLNLREFTLQSDLSHFIYFPLKRVPNQTDLIQLQSVVDWDILTELNLSHNRLTSIDGFHLPNTCPNLKKLDVSYNYLEKVTALLRCRNLPLRSLSLEGNPLCHDYTDPREYVNVVRMLFPTVRTLDGITIHLKGDLPAHQKNHCHHGAENIVEKYLDTFFPLLEAQPSDRQLVEDMYDENALMTVLYRYKFLHRLFRISSSSSKFVDDGVKDIVEGATSITKYINKWPIFKHDPFTFTVDVMFHHEKTTVVKICGILKLTAESLAEDEHIISFSRTTLLHTSDGIEYKILNELLLWDEPSNECHAGAFQITKIRSRKLYVDLEFESTPDEETKEKLVVIFEHLTELDRHSSRKCLERKDWNLRDALDNFIQLLKLNDLSSIRPSADDIRGKPAMHVRSKERQLVTLTQ